MFLSPPEEALQHALDHIFGANPPDVLGVAVSGGGDSLALLDMLRRWGGAHLKVVSVNHGLRAEAAEELALVAAYAADHGLSHDSLTWAWDGVGNLQQAARDGRRIAIAQWAKEQGICCVALGHTKDDQAETFLMRLARGSGVDGLAAMAPRYEQAGITWVRPLLEVGRESLRVYLREQYITWADDPSNEDPRFDRVKARQMLSTLGTLGLTVDRLVQTADHMAREKEVAGWALIMARDTCVTHDAGDVILRRAIADTLPAALLTRLLAESLSKVSGAAYRPRFRAVQAAMQAERPMSLHGCLILPAPTGLRITREWAAIQNLRCCVTEIWDGRWQIQPPEGADVEGLHIGALSAQGLRQMEAPPSPGLPRQSLLSSPAVWCGDTLIAAPLAGLKNGWKVSLV
ncbi:tRNA lysidine(34) synthetase TilS [Shimia marina]|uniref:tRNA(Ile)-lysidine synthase n=1 Tax=Shimia marina TaxID=321267 RepID=A0A0P1EPL7_9RHOB|nr:tRNA lysidine(34) synthetase TilS [Shimia marina]CUH52061.1 tRNA(Ile)-lysidine synthase [Shimia marina]SFE60651.1 tRNA(Ile)-lysidine synthase [Shimia marina]